MAEKQHQHEQRGIPLPAGEILTGIAFAALGVWFYLMAGGLRPPVNPYDVGPSAFPRLIAGAQVLVALLLTFHGVRRLKSSLEIIEIPQWWRVAVFIAGTVAYAYAMPRAGFYLASAIWVPLMLLTAGVRNVVGMVAITGLFLAFAWGLFATALDVRLP